MGERERGKERREVDGRKGERKKLEVKEARKRERIEGGKGEKEGMDGKERWKE